MKNQGPVSQQYGIIRIPPFFMAEDAEDTT